MSLKKPFPVVVSFFTENTPYEEEIQNLIQSCKKYDLETSIDSVPSFGSWELNCAYKPFFILKKMKELKKPLLWVDADGKFMKSPDWLDCFDADLSIRLDLDAADDHPSKVISSTMFINSTQKAGELIRDWAKCSQKMLLDPEREFEFWDQIALRDAVLENAPGAAVSCLPLSYAKIFDHPDDVKQVNSPVIEHYQASRRFKFILNSELL